MCVQQHFAIKAATGTGGSSDGNGRFLAPAEFAPCIWPTPAPPPWVLAAQEQQHPGNGLGNYIAAGGASGVTACGPVMVAEGAEWIPLTLSLPAAAAPAGYVPTFAEADPVLDELLDEQFEDEAVNWLVEASSADSLMWEL
ncbi:hypothetical protein GPECTOR_63g17 [Gonium pectorale]|uniref:Uncharacterized protein n=1 Tax=Gonium pectorale TaxID=33097 RepID=A0A150G4D7_GONPE|nr:hypothetical protein GPECTOR_63g17 [Gonium pectorale]|eukprot:KXZ44688.1 hypothetical protein GPECTOR_63g17 [Gonium pectorale]